MTDDRAIEQVHLQWARAVQLGDVDGALKLLAPEYVLWATGVAPLQGPQTIGAMLANAFTNADIEASFECESRVIDGNLAVERGWDVQTARPRTGGDAQTRRQRVTIVMRRDPQHGWRFLWGMSQPAPIA